MSALQPLAVAFVGVLMIGCDKGQAPPPRQTNDAGPADQDTRGPIYGPIDGRWRTFAVPGEPLTVDFPGEPREGRKIIKAEHGDLVQTRYMVAERQARVFMVSVERWPAGTTPPDAPLDALLRDDADSCVARKLAQDVESHRLDLGGVPGMDVRVVTQSGARHHLRVFRRGETVYCIAAMLNGRTDSEEMDRFIASIHFADAESP